MKGIILFIVAFALDIVGLAATVSGLVILANTGMNAALIIGPILIIAGVVVAALAIKQMFPDVFDELKSFFSD